MPTPRIIAWKVGANFGKWHVMAEPGKPWCGHDMPSQATICELESHPAMILADLCKPCLIAYAMSEAE